MISFAFQDLILTVIAVCLIAITVTVAWFAHRASRTLDRYDRLVPTLERVGLRAEAALAQAEAAVDDLRGAAASATSFGRNGADGVDAAIGLVRQLGAVGAGIRSAMDAFQDMRREQRTHGG